MDLSIIIPVYNVERYIRKCLNSIYSQNINQDLFEVIVVNDGTKDNSMSIVEEFANTHNNLSILNQKNQGLSIARNNGIKIAQGRYVWCVDSDDWISDNALNIILPNLNKDYDTLKILLRRVKESDGTYNDDTYNQYLKDKRVVRGKDYLFDEGQFAPAQNFIYKKQFLYSHELSYYPNIYHEDAEFGFRALYLAKSVCLIKNVCYNYLLRDSNSIMSSFKLKNFQDLLLIYKNLTEFRHEHVNPNDYKYWDGSTTKLLYTYFGWAKNKNYKKMHKDEFWKLYSENKKIFKENLHKIFYAKHFHKHFIKEFLILRYIPQLYFC